MYSDFGYSLPISYSPSTGVPSGDSMGFDVFGREIDIGDAKEWWELSQDVVDIWGDIYAQAGGGSSPWGSAYSNNPFDVCPGTPNFDAVARWTESAPDSDVSQVIRFLKDGNHGKGPSSRAELADPQYLPNWVKALMGGKDCRAKSYPEAPGMFQQSVRQYGGPGIQESVPEEQRPYFPEPGKPFIETVLLADTENVAMWAVGGLGLLYFLKKML